MHTGTLNMNCRKKCQPGLSILAVFFLWTLPAFSFDEKLDTVIKGGRIVDGTGSPWYAADLGIDDSRIVRIGIIQAEDATTVIDASGLIVAPGFIDMMGQTASPMVDHPKSAISRWQTLRRQMAKIRGTHFSIWCSRARSHFLKP